MTVFTFDETHALHREAGHPERPERLAAVRALMEREGLWDEGRRLPTPEASDEALARVHAEAYLELLDEVAAAGGARLDPDTYATADSVAVARRAVGGLLAATDAVLEGRAANAFALTRPPGHHARPFAPMGFCLYANVALAVEHARAAHGVERVLVVDFDVHHGNGTQEVFYADPDVLVVTSQQYPFWPGTGAITEVGVGAGRGATVNLPLPAGTGDALVALYRRVLPPLAARHRPEAVFLSAGYDAHYLDPIGGLALSVAGFADLARLVMEVADAHAGGRLVAALEGGYHADALAHAVASTLRVLADPSAEALDPFGPAPAPGPPLAALEEAVCALHAL
ncbi:MAG TPA: histone deacetylase [Rubricoccaceae bacterium]|nr:histone deacetylase [Rubricoccaceae bacterium]